MEDWNISFSFNLVPNRHVRFRKKLLDDAYFEHDDQITILKHSKKDVSSLPKLPAKTRKYTPRTLNLSNLQIFKVYISPRRSYCFVCRCHIDNLTNYSN